MSKQPKKTSNEPASIGVARMLEDGTITLFIRAEGPGSVRGDALLTYERAHPEYATVLKHVGGLQIGEEKPVPPWT